MYTVELNQCLDLWRVLDDEVTRKYKIKDNEISSHYIERDYGIRIRFGNTSKGLTSSTVTFLSKAQYTMMMLKYL
jgi:hypothetical protein